MVFIIFLLIMLALGLIVDGMIVFNWYRLHELTTEYLEGVDRINKELGDLKKELDGLCDILDEIDEFSKDQA